MLKLLNFSCSRCLFPSDHSDHFLVNINKAHQTRKGHGPEDAGAGRPRASRAMLGGDAEALLDAYSLEDVPIGRLDLTPSLIERARAVRRDAPLA